MSTSCWDIFGVLGRSQKPGASLQSQREVFDRLGGVQMSQHLENIQNRNIMERRHRIKREWGIECGLIQTLQTRKTLLGPYPP